MESRGSIREGVEMSPNAVHDTNTCSPDCVMCSWVNDRESARRPARDQGMDDFLLENELADYANTYGSEALLEKLDYFMACRGLY